MFSTFRSFPERFLRINFLCAILGFKGVTDKDGGLFYMLLLNDQDKLLEFGLTPALSKQGLHLSNMTSRVKRDFIIKPKPVYLPGKWNVMSVKTLL